jgi:hypothetical protein
MMRTTTLALALGLATLSGVAAAQAPQSMPQRMPAAAVTDEATNTLTVQNDRKVPVAVTMEYGDFDYELGTVPPFGSAALPLPGWAVKGRATVRLFAHPENQVGDLESDEFTLQPPARLALEVRPWGYVPPPDPRDTMTAVIPPAEQNDATLTVDNPRADAVTAHSRVTLRFPDALVGEDASLQLFVRPARGFDLAGDLMEVDPGDHLGLRVPAH